MAHHKHRFSDDPYSSAAFWGPSTSAANFCEEDYAVTIYLAEFVNSLTNLAYIYYAVRHALNRKEGQSFNGSDFMSASLFLLGIASFGFHATLRQTAQLFDDLSMLLLGTSFLLCVYTANQPTTVRYALAAFICSSISVVSVVYLRSQNILLHTYSFATILMLIWPRTLYLIRSKPSLKPHHPSPQKDNQFPARKVQSSLRKHRSIMIHKLTKSGMLLTVAFILWNIDLRMCWELRLLRSQVGQWLGWLLQLHGWWHILTAVAAFDFMELIRDLCVETG